MLETLPEKPQTLGDLIGHSIRIFRSNVPLLYSVFLWPSIATCASMAACRLIFGHWISLHKMSLELFSLHAVAELVSISVLAFAQWELMLRGLAVLRLTVVGDDSYEQAYQYAIRRWRAALLVYTLTIVMPLFVMIFWTIVGILVILFAQQFNLKQHITMLPFAVIGLLFTLTLCWSFLFGSMMLCVLACENINVKQAVERAESLSLHYLWRGGSFVALLGIVLLLLSFAIDMPLIVISLLDSYFHSGPSQFGIAYQLPMYLEVLTACWGSIMNIVLFSIAIIADGLYYHDVCLRFDGLDIKMKLAQLS